VALLLSETDAVISVINKAFIDRLDLFRTQGNIVRADRQNVIKSNVEKGGAILKDNTNPRTYVIIKT